MVKKVILVNGNFREFVVQNNRELGSKLSKIVLLHATIEVEISLFYIDFDPHRSFLADDGVFTVGTFCG